MYEVLCRLRPGISLLALYGTLHQLRRMEIYETFCKKQFAVLFATDIAARGLGKNRKVIYMNISVNNNLVNNKTCFRFSCCKLGGTDGLSRRRECLYTSCG